MELGLRGKVALVTAASRGLGRACAVALAAEGMRVAVSARDRAALEKVAAEIDECLVLPADLADPRAPDRLVAAVRERFGALHALVVSTPGPPSGLCVDVTDRQWRDALELNLLAPIRVTQAALPLMRAQRDGRVVYIGTIGVRTAQHGMVLSNSTRLALMGYAKTLSVELAADNVLVNMVAPGPLGTERMDELYEQTARREGISVAEAKERWLAEVPLRRIGRAEDLAAAVALLVSEPGSYTTGAVIPVDGGKAPGY